MDQTYNDYCKRARRAKEEDNDNEVNNFFHVPWIMNLFIDDIACVHKTHLYSVRSCGLELLLLYCI